MKYKVFFKGRVASDYKHVFLVDPEDYKNCKSKDALIKKITEDMVKNQLEFEGYNNPVVNTSDVIISDGLLNELNLK
jgi:hypothetical protein